MHRDKRKEKMYELDDRLPQWQTEQQGKKTNSMITTK
jgi:hypothetical protein